MPEMIFLNIVYCCCANRYFMICINIGVAIAMLASYSAANDETEQEITCLLQRLLR